MSSNYTDEIIISIMVTYYNQKRFIKDSLSSILSQDLSYRYEVLCGDDGSNDGTYEELLEWQEKYNNIVRVFQMPRDSSKKYEPIHRVSQNRLNLLKNSRGKYICFLDGDDFYLDNNKLQIQVDLLEKNLSCVACGHPYQLFWDANSELGEVQRLDLLNEALIIKSKIYWAFIWLHADTFVYRNVIKDKIDTINNKLFDDNLITAYFLNYGDVLYFPKPMLAYRQINNSSWNSRNTLQKAFVDICMYVESKKILKGMRIATFIRCFHALRQIYLERNNEIIIDNSMSSIMNNRFVQRTVLYNKSSWIYHFTYNIRYFAAMNLGFIIKSLKKIKKLGYRRAIV